MKSSDSFSDRFSQLSPSNNSQTPFSSEKYQKILKTQIYADYRNKRNEVNHRASRKFNKYEALFQENQISSDSFERRRDSLERWKAKNYQILEKKKNNYLMYFGNLNELIAIMKDKDQKSVNKKDKSFISESDVKFSDNISYSELSNKHERRKSGNYMNTDFRNYVKEAQQYSFASTDEQQNKKNDRLNLSKDSEKVNSRLSKLEILKDYSRTIKGPVVAKNKDSKYLALDDEPGTGRRSETLKPNLNLEDYVINEPDKSVENDLEEFLQAKTQEKDDINANKDTLELPKNQVAKRIKYKPMKHKDSDDLVGFPSDDEASKKFKDIVMDDINSVDSESHHRSSSDTPHNSDLKSENEFDKQKSNATVKDKVPSHVNGNKNEAEKWPAGFPSIEDRVIYTSDQAAPNVPHRPNSEILIPNSNSVNDVSQKEIQSQYYIENDNVAITPKDNDDSLNYGINEDNKSDIFESPSIEPIGNDDILLISSQANIKTNNNDITGFTDEEQRINQSFKASDLQIEDSVPEKPSALDNNDIPAIEHASESEDLTDSKKYSKVNVLLGKIAEMIFEGIKEPTPSIKDIMNEDLTGSMGAQSKKKSRTEDDLPGGAAAKTKQERADALADELLFYLVSECRNNFFPQRVNPEKLKLKTAEEIEKFEQSKKDKIEDNKEAIEAKSAEELRESLENETPISKMAIKTGSATVKNYMKELFKKVENNEEDFIINLSSPLQRNPLEILMHLQNTQYELENNEQLPYQPSVMTVEVYLDIERARKREEEINLLEQLKISKLKHDEEKAQKEASSDAPLKPIKDLDASDDDASSSDDNKSEFTKDQELSKRVFNLKCEWENIHNKVIFDAVNEALDGLRPYGLKGPPLPWSKQNRILTYKNGDIAQVPKILEQIDSKIMGWTKTYAGTLNFSELLKEYRIPYLDDDQLVQVREERLALLLATEIEENEPIWTDYEFEETQVNIDLANVILDELVQETVNFLRAKDGEIQQDDKSFSAEVNSLIETKQLKAKSNKSF